tara:strand:+ start:81 stop:494 length:414 start_codon:yes stop_codon:yes gene_type:complete
MKPVLAWCDHVWDSIVVFKNGSRCEYSPEWLFKKKIIIRAGVGQPHHVTEMAKCYGAQIIFVSDVKDHSPFTNSELEEFGKYKPDAVLMTEKDYIKLPEDAQKHMCVAVPNLGLRFIEGTEAALFGKIETALEKIKS